jgi:hypothetical protein
LIVEDSLQALGVGDGFFVEGSADDFVVEASLQALGLGDGFFVVVNPQAVTSGPGFVCGVLQ